MASLRFALAELLCPRQIAAQVALANPVHVLLVLARGLLPRAEREVEDLERMPRLERLAAKAEDLVSASLPDDDVGASDGRRPSQPDETASPGR